MRQFYLIWGLAIVITLIFISDSKADDTLPCWNGFMGSNRSGRSLEPNVIPDQNPVLVRKWTQKIGTGYSAVSLIKDTAVTMYSDEQFDYVIALNINDGSIRWKYKIGPTYKGHGNSQDGPLSTPFIYGEKVFCLSPYGLLFSLSLQDGTLKWSSDLEVEFKAKAPDWGFTSSPLVYEDNVFILAGGTGKSSFILAFDVNTGELTWKFGNDFAHYRSATISKVNGEIVLLAIGNETLYCLLPSSGELEWVYHVKNGFKDSATPITVADRQILVQTDKNGLQLLTIDSKEEPNVELSWENHRISGSYSSPVVHQNYIYCYSGRFLTCISLDTGRIKWKSRDPGEGFPILVDDHLLILTKKGSLSIGVASPNGYEEKVSLKLFEELAWSFPSFYQGSIYARSYGEIARVSVNEVKNKKLKTDNQPVSFNSKFEKWVNRVDSASQSEKLQLTENFLLSHKSLPIIEDNNYVHFVYQGDAIDVAINSDHLGIWDESKMNRIKGTNFFYLSTFIEADARIKYRYIKNFDEYELDPKNKLIIKEPDNTYSWLLMPDCQDVSYEESYNKIQGRIKSSSFFSSIYDREQNLKVYLPPNYSEKSVPLPVVYVHLGRESLEFGQVHFVIDSLITQNIIRPIILVLEMNLDNDEEKYSEYFINELIPFIDKTFQTLTNSENRLKIGNGNSGFISLYTVLKNPSMVSNVACQSSFYWALQREKIINQMIDSAGYQPINIYLDWGKYDIKRSNMDVEGLRERNSRLFNKFSDLGYNISGGELNAGHGWSSWKLEFGEIFNFFAEQQN